MHRSNSRQYPDFGLTEEERRFSVVGHYYEYPGMDGERGEIWCYTDRFSYRPDDVARLYVSATHKTFSIRIDRDGASESRVFEQHNLACDWQDTPDQCSVDGCGWRVTLDIKVDKAWPSGAYRVTLVSQGRGGEDISCQHLFIVAPGRSVIAQRRKGRRVLQVAATGTWLAYNTWGGSNAYQGITGHGRDQYATMVSSQRPWCRGFVSLPADAPRVPIDIALQPAAVPRYPHMEWAFATGHSKKYASAGWASYDSLFFRWAERSGYAIDLCSQHDLHYDPDILAGYDCVAFVGHDEYWTWEMRDAVDHYVEQGGHVARFAGNFMWQTRLEDEGRRQVCYKYRARAEDPVYQTGDATRATNSWEAPEIGRPGALTFGLNATNGVYAGWGGCAARGARGFPVYRPGHWAFSGTGISYGDVLGFEGHVFGYEVDGLDYEIRGGLPYPTKDSGAPDGIEILALGLASLVEESEDLAVEDRFLGDEDARFTAETLFGEASDENVEKIKRGSGMVVNFSRGAGEVFHAGSCEWVAGLLRRDAMVERVTANVLDRYLGKQGE